MNQIKIVEEIKTHIFCSVACSFFENRADYEKMCKNTVLRGRTQMAIWRTRTACWIPKATHTHTICNTHCFSTATAVNNASLFYVNTYFACLVIRVHIQIREYKTAVLMKRVKC